MWRRRRTHAKEALHEMDGNVSSRLCHLCRWRYRRAVEAGNPGEYRDDMDLDRCGDLDWNWHHGLGCKQWDQGEYPNRPEVNHISFAATLLEVTFVFTDRGPT